MYGTKGESGSPETLSSQVSAIFSIWGGFAREKPMLLRKRKEECQKERAGLWEQLPDSISNKVQVSDCKFIGLNCALSEEVTR